MNNKIREENRPNEVILILITLKKNMVKLLRNKTKLETGQSWPGKIQADQNNHKVVMKINEMITKNKMIIMNKKRF